ncbi:MULTISPECIES: class I SAM-dependent DNA methyltransferase [Staphylococcus]|uniref:Class I SAM-dependent methyltransferase n=1 Tax=Staphylococcus lugdunensis TaxID=28035 RepID=A0ABD4EDV6_STALU|nr:MULTISPECIES: class I SAM-dependent methyltransferase [Staphylococcus]ADC87415.1 Methyltransferase [Staphylococcus lugdunensis HKU09-01]ARJ09184.1 SAM-dependent methyltransferase [Staphylococcus lugdunensis]ARJ13880.1 SAM-dependent methyltransferase [Staphylococcus lugdunensis]ARJ16218.1 SAM-dependent methyltransferase [Staphylococcus lugdunensis]ARJ27281.1 SAM-dependent methyltransferase [Staphylococcus lugdunensis]
MMQYQDMSNFYDLFTQDQPYDLWFDIVQQLSVSLPSNPKILDIGCGTGTLTSMLTNIGEVTGMDLSVDMLAIATQKSNQVQWLEGDMTDFNLNLSFDLITIFCDSLNYLPETNDVTQTFANIFNHLSDDGIFIFDVHTPYKMETLFNNQNYIEEQNDTFLAWQAFRGEVPLSVYHEMTFFKLNDHKNYQRFDESHYQRTFDETQYRLMLKQAGFNHIKTFTDFNMNEHSDNGLRLFFIVQK